jgi:hypothetical protein
MFTVQHQFSVFLMILYFLSFSLLLLQNAEQRFVYMRTSVQLWCKTDVHSQIKPEKNDVHQFSLFYLHCHKKLDILRETDVFYLLHSQRPDCSCIKPEK